MDCVTQLLAAGKAASAIRAAADAPCPVCRMPVRSGQVVTLQPADAHGPGSFGQPAEAMVAEQAVAEAQPQDWEEAQVKQKQHGL